MEIARKALGDGTKPVPLTARTIRAVNNALGDRDTLKKNSAFIRSNRDEFSAKVAGMKSELSAKMNLTDAEFDIGRIESETMKILVAKYGENFANVDDGDALLPHDDQKRNLKDAVAEAAVRVAVSSRFESHLLKAGVPAGLARELADRAVGEKREAIDEILGSGEDVSARLEELSASYLKDNAVRLEKQMVADARATARRLIDEAVAGGVLAKNGDIANLLNTVDEKLDKLLSDAEERRRTGKLVTDRLDPVHVRIALRTAPFLDTTAVANAAARGDGKDPAAQLAKLMDKVKNQVSADEEPHTDGSDAEGALSDTVAKLLGVMNPTIARNIGSLGREKSENMFSTAKAEVDNALKVQTSRAESKKWELASYCLP